MKLASIGNLKKNGIQSTSIIKKIQILDSIGISLNHNILVCGSFFPHLKLSFLKTINAMNVSHDYIKIYMYMLIGKFTILLFVSALHKCSTYHKKI